MVVTNGPLLRPRVNGELPGHVFQGQPGEVVELTVQLNLSLRDRVDYLEVIQNGKVVHEVRLEEYRDRRGTLPAVRFDKSGWMLVRAVTANPQTFRFASTGPYYVEIGQQPRISREIGAVLSGLGERAHGQLEAARSRAAGSGAQVPRDGPGFLAAKGRGSECRMSDLTAVIRAAGPTRCARHAIYSRHDFIPGLASLYPFSSHYLSWVAASACTTWTRERGGPC